MFLYDLGGTQSCILEYIVTLNSLEGLKLLSMFLDNDQK